MLKDSTRNSKPRVHFCGIGGTGMVAGARLAVEAGWEVRGSDNPLYPPTSGMVADLGVPVATQYDAANLDWGPDLVVIGNVLSRGNPEVEAALERKLHYVSLPEWLKETVLRHRRPVAICGTHGKTTTTALTTFLLDRAGLDPGFLIGGQVINYPYSARLGSEAAPFVIEGDEYDSAFFDKRAKFLHYMPEIAIVTSVEFDHGDIYCDLGEIERAFRLMLRQIRPSGWLVACADDPGAATLKDHAFSQVATYGFHDEADWRGEWDGTSGRGADGRPVSKLVVHRGGQPWVDLDVPLAGRHNLQNTLAAVAVTGILDADPDAIRKAIGAFRGVARRMEVFLERNEVTLVDDFAHHPTAVQETIAAARSHWPDRRLRVLLEPRSNTMITNRFSTELGEALSGADEVWIGPIYRSDRIPPEERLDRQAVVDGLSGRGICAQFSDDVGRIVDAVHTDARAGDIVLVMSNGAFGGIRERLCAIFEKDPS